MAVTAETNRLLMAQSVNNAACQMVANEKRWRSFALLPIKLPIEFYEVHDVFVHRLMK